MFKLGALFTALASFFEWRAEESKVKLKYHIHDRYEQQKNRVNELRRERDNLRNGGASADQLRNFDNELQLAVAYLTELKSDLKERSRVSIQGGNGGSEE